jgi:hypothetical protein
MSRANDQLKDWSKIKHATLNCMAAKPMIGVDQNMAHQVVLFLLRILLPLLHYLMEMMKGRILELVAFCYACARYLTPSKWCALRSCLVHG